MLGNNQEHSITKHAIKAGRFEGSICTVEIIGALAENVTFGTVKGLPVTMVTLLGGLEGATGGAFTVIGTEITVLPAKPVDIYEIL